MMHGLSRDTRRALRRAKRRRAAELNIVSMIDILTVLVFFLLVNSIGVSILGVNLPDERSSSKEPPPHALSVIIRETGLTLTDVRDVIGVLPREANGEYPMAKLGDALRELKQKLPNEQDISLRLEAGVPYEVLVAVMDAARIDPTVNDVNKALLFPNISLGDAPPVSGVKP